MLTQRKIIRKIIVNICERIQNPLQGNKCDHKNTENW
jgi:hypothetical protein